MPLCHPRRDFPEHCGKNAHHYDGCYAKAAKIECCEQRVMQLDCGQHTQHTAWPCHTVHNADPQGGKLLQVRVMDRTDIQPSCAMVRVSPVQGPWQFSPASS